jgi:monovalent cation:H+ antiporter-2, CPA2 family
MEALNNFILILIIAVAVLVLFSRLKIPSVIGFLLTGIIISTLGGDFVKKGHELELLAEVGIMLLMFNIGLEFSIAKIKQMKHEVLVYGGLQVMVTIVAVILLMHFSGFSASEAIFGSFIVSLSSTAIVLKMMQDKGKMNSPAGRIMLGILLFQDLCVVPLIILTPLLSSFDQIEPLLVLGKLAKSFVLIAAIFLLAKFLLPKVFDYVCSHRVSELFILLVIAIMLGLALLTHKLGFSVALGAFIAGMILAESDYIHQIEADIKPLKNVFLSVFFISVGLLLDVNFLIANPGKIFLSLIVIILIKSLIIYLLLKLFKVTHSLSLKAGIGLSQIGEFAFMLLNIAVPAGVIDEKFSQLILSVSVVSMLITPLLIGLAFFVGRQSALKGSIKDVFEEQKQVIIAGYGINGINLSRIFKNLNISYRIIEMNANTVRRYRREGEPIVYGDITQPENLKKLGIEKASMLVVAISDADASRRAVELARKMNPSLRIIARSEFFSQIEPLYQSGANVVISQDFEASLQIASYVLKFFGIAEPIVKIKSDQLRKRHYGFFTQAQGPNNTLKIAELASVENYNETFLALENPSLIGRLVSEVNIKLSETFKNIKIVAIVRDDVIISDFPSDITIERLDTLVLYGKQSLLDSAVEYLDNFF